jgi:hypothetical protein
MGGFRRGVVFQEDSTVVSGGLLFVIH